MHMADALVSPAVAGVAAAVSVTLLAVSARKVKKSATENLVPLMGVMGAFVFGRPDDKFYNSRHRVERSYSRRYPAWGIARSLGGISDACIGACGAMSDICRRGLMALGCNLLNMGVCSTLIAYPFIYRPIAGSGEKTWRVITAAVVASVVGLELGALLVTAETELSGVTALPAKEFLGLMTSIHFFIGIGEGIATAAVLYFVKLYQPSLLAGYRRETGKSAGNYKRAALVFLGIAVVLGVAFTWIASGKSRRT